MKLAEVHPDIERFLAEDCYCPNEVYSVDGMFFQLVYAHAECKVIGTYPDKHDPEETITFVVTASGAQCDHPILLNIWHTADKVTSMERYEYSESNVKNIDMYLKSPTFIPIELTESEALARSVKEILHDADALLIS